MTKKCDFCGSTKHITARCVGQVAADKACVAMLHDCYTNILFKITTIARFYNYAIAFHGSGKRDLDLIAVPWEDDCCDAETFVKHVLDHSNGFIGPSEKYPILKPHGRKSWVIFVPDKPGYGCRGYVDLSVMPRIKKI